MYVTKQIKIRKIKNKEHINSRFDLISRFVLSPIRCWLPPIIVGINEIWNGFQSKLQFPGGGSIRARDTVTGFSPRSTTKLWHKNHLDWICCFWRLRASEAFTAYIYVYTCTSLSIPGDSVDKKSSKRSIWARVTTWFRGKCIICTRLCKPL